MVLSEHSTAGFNDKSEPRSRAGAHIFFSEDDNFPRWNGPLLTIAQIMKYVLTSATEAETAALLFDYKGNGSHALFGHTGGVRFIRPLNCTFFNI